MKTIIVNIDETGEVKLETIGFTGKACLEETKFLKDLLGKETARQLTPAYFAVEGKATVKKHLPLCG
jgi:hypothetical protein